VVASREEAERKLEGGEARVNRGLGEISPQKFSREGELMRGETEAGGGEGIDSSTSLPPMGDT